MKLIRIWNLEERTFDVFQSHWSHLPFISVPRLTAERRLSWNKGQNDWHAKSYTQNWHAEFDTRKWLRNKEESGLISISIIATWQNEKWAKTMRRHMTWLTDWCATENELPLWNWNEKKKLVNWFWLKFRYEISRKEYQFKRQFG